MKRPLLHLLAILAFACAEAEPPVQGTTERLAFDPPQLSFGDVPVKGSRAMRLAVANSGQALVNLAVEGVEGPFEVEQRGISLPPAAEGELLIRFKPQREQAESGRLLLRSGGGEQHAYSLSGRGVLRALLIEPEEIDFGQQSVGASERRRFRVRNVADGALHLLLELEGSTAFSVDTVPFPLEAGAVRELEVSFSPTQHGSQAAWLEISPCTDCLAQRISFSGEGSAAELSLSPQTLDFGTVPLGFQPSVEVLVLNTGTAVGSVEGVEVVAGEEAFGFEVEGGFPAEIAPGKNLSITVRFDAIEARNFAGMLRIEGPHGALKLPLSASVGGPRLEAKPLDFGLVPPGVPVVQPIFINNEGAPGPIVLFEAEVEGPSGAFRLAQPVEQTHSGWRAEVEILAQTEGEQLGTLLVPTNLPYQQVLAIPLRGEVRDAPCQLGYEPPGPLHFGMVDGERPIRLPFEITHAGDDDCLFWGPRFGDASLQLVSGAFQGVKKLSKGEAWSFIAQRGPSPTASFETSFTVSHGRAGEQLEAPFTFEAVAPFPFDEPEELVIRDTPVGRVTMNVNDLRPKGYAGYGVWAEVVGSDEFVVGPYNLNWAGVGLPIFFRPAEQGARSAWLYVYRADYPEPFILRLRGEGIRPCTSCEWPEASCSLDYPQANRVRMQSGLTNAEARCVWAHHGYAPGLSEVSIDCPSFEQSLPEAGSTSEVLFMAFDAEHRAVLCEFSIAP